MTLVVGVFCSSWNKCAYGGDGSGVWNGYLARAFLGSEARHRNLVYVETGYRTYGSAGLLRQEDKLVCVTAFRLLQFGCVDARK